MNLTDFPDPGRPGRLAEIRALEACNERTARFGLRLSETQLRALEDRRDRALRETGRVEFGGGILKQLILTFCGSPYLLQQEYEETLAALQDAFYALKNETGDRIPDDELIDAMRRAYDGKAGGSVEALAGLTPEELFQDDEPEEPDDSGRPG